VREVRVGRLGDGWACWWWEGGRRRRYRLRARSESGAAREAAEVYRRETRPSVVLTEHVVSAYCDALAGRRAAARLRSSWKQLEPSFGGLRPDEITPATVAGHVERRRAQGRRGNTIWTELTDLRAALSWAEGQRVIERAPRIPRPPKPRGRERIMEPAEIDRLFVVAREGPPHLLVACALMYGTLARPGAALDLTWDRVHFERREIDLRLTADSDAPKKGRAVAPMADWLRAILAPAREVALSPHVVEWHGRPVTSIKTGFRALCAKAELEGVTPHVLRHAGGQRLAAAGVPMERISALMGHTSVAVTARVYARFAPERLREEADLLAPGSRMNTVRSQVRRT
jgi:integrase